MATNVRASSPQRATFVELFFDLVFVFAVTQVTHTLAEHLDARGVVTALVVFGVGLASSSVRSANP